MKRSAGEGTWGQSVSLLKNLRRTPGLVLTSCPHYHLLHTSDIIFHAFTSSTGLRGANRPLMHWCQQAASACARSPGQLDSHSTLTQSTKSHCGLIGSSSCGNQFRWEFLNHLLILCKNEKKEKWKWVDFKQPRKGSHLLLNTRFTSAGVKTKLQLKPCVNPYTREHNTMLV